MIYISKEKPSSGDYACISEEQIYHIKEQYSGLIKMIKKLPGIGKLHHNSELSDFINDLIRVAGIKF